MLLKRMYSNPLTTIVLVGVLIRVIVAILYGHATIYPDSSGYIELAQRIRSFDLSGYEGGRSPGYPLLLSLAGASPLWLVILQMAVGVITSVFIYKALLIIFVRRRKALLFTLLWVCYIPALFFELAVLSETLTLLVITLIFYVYFGITMQKRTGILSYLLLSLLCTCLVAIKSFYILIPAMLFVFLVLSDRRIRVKAILYKYLIVLALPFMMFCGWCNLNKANTGYFTPTTFAGYNIAQNCVNFAENTSDQYKEIGKVYAKHREADIAQGKDKAMSIWSAYDELRETTGLSFADLSNELYNYSLTTIAMNPMEYLSQVFVSWANFWKTSLYWEYDSFNVPNSNVVLKIICYAERVILQVVKCLFILLIPYNIIRYIRKRKYSPQFIISVLVLLVSLAQAFVTFGTNSRFSFPFEVLIATSVLMNYLSFRKGRRDKKQKS